VIVTDAATRICIGCRTRPVAYDGTWLCGGCFARLRSDLAAVVDAYDQLAEGMSAIAPGWRTGAIHGSEEARLPFDPDLHDLRVRIIAALERWTGRVLAEHPGRLHGPADRTLTTAVEWMRIHLPWCSGQSWVEELARELRTLIREAGTSVGLQTAYRKLPTPCGGCGRLTLVEYTGDDAVTCRNRDCGGLYDWPTYIQLVDSWCARVTMEARRRRGLARTPTDDDRRLAAALDQDDDDPAGIWLTTDEAAEAAHVAAGTIRSWASRHELTAEFVDDVPYYRLDHVLAREAATRTARRELSLLGEAFAHLHEREQHKRMSA
jgi:hypothetical protein